LSLVELCRKWAEQNPIIGIEKISVKELKERLEKLNKLDEKCSGQRRTFRVFLVILYPENTEYPFAKEVLTNKKRSDSISHWFPVFELDLEKRRVSP